MTQSHEAFLRWYDIQLAPLTIHRSRQLVFVQNNYHPAPSDLPSPREKKHLTKEKKKHQLTKCVVFSSRPDNLATTSIYTLEKSYLFHDCRTRIETKRSDLHDTEKKTMLGFSNGTTNGTKERKGETERRNEPGVSLSWVVEVTVRVHGSDELVSPDRNLL